MIPKCPKHNRIKPKRAAPMAPDEKRHANRIAQMSCLVCGCRPVEVHHVKLYPGAKRDHRYVAPLCPAHHRTGPQAAHSLSRADFDKLICRNLRMWVKEQWEITCDILGFAP